MRDRCLSCGDWVDMLSLRACRHCGKGICRKCACQIPDLVMVCIDCWTKWAAEQDSLEAEGEGQP